MKHILKRIIVGLIIGFVLMCARKYLFINASASTKTSQAFNTNSFDSFGLFGMNYNTAYNSAYSKSLDGGFSYLAWSFNNVNAIDANAFFFFKNFNYNYDYAYFTIYQNIATNNSGNCSTLSTFTSVLPVVKLGSVPCEVVYTRNDDNYGQRASFKCPITDSNHLAFFYPQNMGKICSSEWGIQNFVLYYSGNDSAIIDSIDNGSQAISDSVDQVNDTLSDSSTDDPDSAIEDMQDYVPTNGTISQLLTLPISLYQNILNSVSGSCSSFNLGSLLGTSLLLPCINLQQLLGSTLYGVIDILCSGFFILSFRKKMVDIFNHMTSLNDRGNEVE